MLISKKYNTCVGVFFYEILYCYLKLIISFIFCEVTNRYSQTF